MKILISAGPTIEPIDAVRYLSNRSSGKMGRALCEVACKAGHAVTVVHGPMALPADSKAQWIPVETGQEMLEALRSRMAQADVLIMAAAVCDFRPAARHSGKQDKAGLRQLELEPTADILAELTKEKRGKKIVSFSLENDMQAGRPLQKLKAKSADWCVVNTVASMGADQSDFRIIDADGEDILAPVRISKYALAERLMELIGRHWGSP